MLLKVRKWRRRVGWAVWAVAMALGGAWALTAMFGDIGLYGDLVGIAIRERGGSVSLDVATGWPDAAWMRRSPLRAPGDRADRRFDDQGVRIGRESRRWNGNTPIIVTWYGVSLPGWYCALIAVAPAVELALRRAVATRRRRRERTRDPWRSGLCPNCGYDLRARHERCPECGTAIPDTARVYRVEDTKEPTTAGPA
jgi:hypothetical protein